MLTKAMPYKMILTSYSSLKMEMKEAMGITDQREAKFPVERLWEVSERSVLQSSHITEWLFTIHDDIRKEL